MSSLLEGATASTAEIRIRPGDTGSAIDEFYLSLSWRSAPEAGRRSKRFLYNSRELTVIALKASASA